MLINSLVDSWKIFIKNWRLLFLTIFLDTIFIIGFLAIQVLTLIKNQDSIQKITIMLSKNFETFNLLNPSMEVLQTTVFAENYSLLLSWFAINIVSTLLLFIACKGINWTLTICRMQSVVCRPIIYFSNFALTTVLGIALFTLFFKAFYFLGMNSSLFISVIITFFFAARVWSLTTLKNYFKFNKSWLIAYFASFLAITLTFGGFLVNPLLGAITVIIMLPLVEQFSRIWLISTANTRNLRKFSK